MLNRLIPGSIVVFTVSIIFSIALAQTMVGVLALLWVWRCIDAKSMSFKATPLDFPILMFIMARVLSIVLSTDVKTSIAALNVEVIFYISFYLITQLFDVTDSKNVQLLIRSLFVAAAVASIIGVAKYVLSESARASSTTSGYYTLGGYLCLVLTIALFLGGAKDFVLRRWLWMVFCVLTGCGIVFTFDRLHWFAIALVILYVGLVKERKLLLLFVVGGCVLVMLSPTVASRLDDLFHVFSRSSDRDVLWKGASLIWNQHPVFGFGPRTFDQIFQLRDQVADKGIGGWHNDFLQVYIESGVIGLGSLLWIFVSTFRIGAKTLQSSLLPENLRPLLRGLLCSVAVVVLIGGMFDLLVGLLIRLILALIALIAVSYGLSNRSSHANVASI